MSFTANGNEFIVLKPTDNTSVTSFVVELYWIEEIPTPFGFWIGKIVGVALFNPEVFFKISTLLLPTLNFKSTSGTRLLVFPSKTMSFGGVV